VGAGMQRERIETERSAAARRQSWARRARLIWLASARRRKSSCGASPMRAPRPRRRRRAWSPSASAPSQAPPRRKRRGSGEKGRGAGRGPPQKEEKPAARAERAESEIRAAAAMRSARREELTRAEARERLRPSRRALDATESASAEDKLSARPRRDRGGGRSGRLAKERGESSARTSSSSKRGAMPSSGPATGRRAPRWKRMRAGRTFARRCRGAGRVAPRKESPPSATP